VYPDLFLQYTADISFIIFLKKNKLKIFVPQRISLMFDKYHLEILFWQ